MTADDFRAAYSEFPHRILIERKLGSFLKIKDTLEPIMGVKGKDWINQPMAHPTYHAIWFRRKMDAAFAILKLDGKST